MLDFQSELMKSYEDLKALICSSKINVDFIKNKFGISNRRLSYIYNVRDLIDELEKVCDLDPYNVEALKVICGSDHPLYENIQIHEERFILSNVQRQKWYTPYYDEVQKDKSESRSEVISLICRDIGDSWRQFGRCMKLEEASIEKIESSISGTENKAKECLLEISKRCSPEERKRIICSALSRVRRNDIRKKVEKLL